MARLALLGVLLIGRCGLMAAEAYATDGPAHHDHIAAPTGVVLGVPQADPSSDPCCIDKPALASQGVSLDKPPAHPVFGEDGMLAVGFPPGPVAHPRGPPARLHAGRHHVRLQIFLI